MQVSLLIPSKDRPINIYVPITLDDQDLKCWENVLDAFSNVADTTITQLYDALVSGNLAITKVEELCASGAYYFLQDDKQPKKKLKGQKPT
jgi:hypothetical protein